MSSVKVILRPDKVNANNEHPLWLRVCKNRKSKYITIGIEIKPEQWDEKKQRVRRSHPNAEKVNAFIGQKVSEAEGVVVELQTQNKYIGSYNIKEALLGKVSTDFFPFADKFANSFEAAGKIGSYRRAKSVIQKLRDYVENRALTFNQITVSFLTDYERYLSSKMENRQNTIHANMRLIRTVINNAIREDLVPMELNPFTKFKLKSEKTQRAYLTEEELNDLDNLSLVEGSMMNHHRNIYVFASYAGGLRISDVLLLRWKNFDGEKLNIKIQKTQSTLSIKLPERALQIVNSYSRENCNGNDFIFPLLKISPDEKSPLAIHQAICSATTYTNKDLKSLAKLAEIDKHLSFHTSRHTWATRALTKGMRIEHVSKLMGHSAIKETQIYAKIISSELDNAMAVFN